MTYATLNAPPRDGITGFRVHLCQLATKHILWSRQYIVSATAGLGDADIAFQQMLSSADQIGQAFAPFIGDADALRVRAALRNQEERLADVVLAYRTGGDTVNSRNSWYKAQAELVALLGRLNPRWQGATLLKLSQQVSQMIEQMIRARLAKDWAADATALNYLLDCSSRCTDQYFSGMMATVVRAVYQPRPAGTGARKAGG